MTHTSNHLRQILVRISDFQKMQKQALLVFDLDSTLFDVSPRLQKILQNFASDPNNIKKFPESCEILKTAETYRTDWGIKNALTRAGLDGHHADFHEELKNYWMQSFFSNEFLKYDLPYQGAVDFVQQCYALGSKVVYLTGRDIPRMQVGTLETLKKWKFPVSMPNTDLVLKPDKSLDDAQFKSDYFASIPSQVYGGIWFFENEPLNVNLVRNDHDHVEIVFFESTHAGKAHPPGDLPKIMHYLLDD